MPKLATQPIFPTDEAPESYSSSYVSLEVLNFLSGLDPKNGDKLNFLEYSAEN